MKMLKSMAHDDEQLYDLAKGMPADYEPPEYPTGLQFSVTKEDLEKAGGEGGEPNATMRFSAMGKVTSTFKDRENCRIEVELTEFAGEDGKFFELSRTTTICFQGPELEKVELSDNAERGDMIHLIGTARVESVASHEAFGDMATLQVTELNYEDESAESREG
jgi:hypothetical protein